MTMTFTQSAEKRFSIKWFCDSFSWHVREFHRWMNGQMTEQEAEAVEIYYGDDDPTEKGFYGLICIAGDDGFGCDVWGDTAFWNGKEWDRNWYPNSNRSEKPFPDIDMAQLWADRMAW
jgi:hypothetical protein